ncbi:MAG: hypothetical protein H6708_28140 [Kofleriaceae bacterium]|nr:hypothetical protein [Kofleriaceae bacterium]
MFIGHFAVGMAAKRVAPRASLPVLLAAPQVLDILFPILVAAGVEKVAIVPGLTAVSPLDLQDIGWSHSLVTSIAWSILFALGYLAITRQRREAVVLGACVASHWVLDWVTHLPDMPLYPGGPRVGLGLWTSLPGCLAVELGMFAIGVWLYAGATRARDRVGSIGWWALVVTLLGMYLGAVFGPPPPDARALVIFAFGAWILLAWGWWVSRHREHG